MGTNEILATMAKTGDDAALLELWENVKALAYKTSTKWVAAGKRCGVEHDDLMQEAFVALMETVQRYDSKRGAFTTLYVLRLRLAFSTACSLRTSKKRNEPLHDAVPLEVRKDDGELITFDPPDPAAELAFCEVEENDYREHLHVAIERMLHLMPPGAANCLRKKYLEGQTVKNYYWALAAARSPHNFAPLAGFVE